MPVKEFKKAKSMSTCPCPPRASLWYQTSTGPWWVPGCRRSEEEGKLSCGRGQLVEKILVHSWSSDMNIGDLDSQDRIEFGRPHGQLPHRPPGAWPGADAQGRDRSLPHRPPHSKQFPGLASRHLRGTCPARVLGLLQDWVSSSLVELVAGRLSQPP